MINIGIALNISAEEGRSDAAVLREHVALGDLAEPLGYDSIFALEHHFTGYVISPAPLQILAYFAGRTKRINLGTAVVVLPWHDPIRVAEQISQLDILCNGRCLFAFGRGTAMSEFEGFRVSMAESRGRFGEAIEIIVGLLANEVFEFRGEFYDISLLSIRPKAISRPEERFYASSMGQESADTAARLGFGMLVSTQKPWATLSTDINRFREVASIAGHRPKHPIVVSAISVAKSRSEAQERALEYLSKDLALVDAHYNFSKGHLATVSGYESYSSTQEHFSRLAKKSYRDIDYIRMQITGTPDDCIEQIEELSFLTDLEHLVLEFSYGGMPYLAAESNMKIFASEVMPIVKHSL